MTPPADDPRRADDPLVAGEGLPVDPDTAPVPPRAPGRRRPGGRVLAAIFLGGCVGGALRYAVTSAWPTPTDRFPWSTFAVNVAGAFLLAVVVVVAADLVSSRHLRPLLGTGFCGALTTFSSVVVGADQLIARHRPGTAAAYLVATVLAGLAAGLLGLIGARAVVGAVREERPC